MSGFNRIKEKPSDERLFRVHYDPQNGEEKESTEELTYAMVQQGRKWFQEYCKDQKKEERDLKSLKKRQEKEKSKEMYAMRMSSAAVERDNPETDASSSLQQTPLHSSNSSNCSTSESRVPTSTTSISSISLGTMGSLSEDAGTKQRTSRRLRQLSILDVSALLESVDMSPQLIAAFVTEQINGATLGSIASIEELTQDYLQGVQIKDAKRRCLWDYIVDWKTAEFELKM